MPENEKNNENEQIKIRFYVSKKEYESIKRGAELTCKSVAAYVRECAVNQYILQFDFDEIREHTKQISETKAALSRLIFTLVQSGNYYSKDIESLTRLLSEISTDEKKIINNFRKLRGYLRRELKQIIDENFKKSGKD